MSAHSAPIEVFYSYTEANEDLRSELDKHLSLLRRDGLITTWHKRQIIAGQDWTKALDQYLNRASIILLLVSSDFLASDYCYGVEMQRAMERHDANEACVIPVLLRPCDRQSAPFGKLQALPSNGVPVTLWGNLDAAFADVAQGIRVALQDAQHLVLSTPRTSFPHIWNIPYPRNPVFTGREEILLRIHTQLQTGRAMAISQAISGLGGMGKTQIAIELAYKHHQDYQAILWTLADTRESLVSEYVTIAELLNLPEKDEQDQTKAVQAVIRWLATHTEWLLILDNADEPTWVYEFLPPKFGGHFLLTTRAQATGPRIHCIEVETMSQDVGALFLLRRAKLLGSDAQLTEAPTADIATAREISEELGGLPLALDQAGAYIEETQCSLTGYQTLYHTQRAKMLKERGSFASDYPKSVATTWSLSFKRVEEQNAAAADLLRLSAFLAPNAIPEELLEQGDAFLGLPLKSIVTDPYSLNEAMKALLGYSLIRRDLQKRTFSVHRLVQVVLKDGTDEQTQRDWMQRAIQAVNEAFPEVEFKEWTRCERLLSHVLVCAIWIEHEPIPIPEAGHLFDKAGTYLRERGQYSEAEPLLVRALLIHEQRLGTEHPSTAGSLSNLAVLYLQQGKYEQAEPLFLRALSIREQQLGETHPSTAGALNNLAELYRQQGKYERAEPLFLRALSIKEQHLGTEHPFTAGSLNNLAILYARQGKYERAEPLFLRALSIQEQQLGETHPSTANSLNNLAELYQDQGKYKEAEPLFLRALAIDENAYGSEHPDIAVRLNNLGKLYSQQRKYEQAEPLYQRALLIFEQHLGSEHPDTTHPLHGLAELYQHQGMYEQAEALYQRALAIREQRLGSTHPETKETRHTYAVFLRIRGRDEEAKKLEEDS